MAGQRLTTQEFIVKAKVIHGNDYNYKNVIYVTSKSKVDIICNKCNTEFTQKASNHLQGQGCPECRPNKKYAQDTFIARCKSKHGSLYNYSKVVFKNLRANIDIICTHCNGTFSQRAKNHLDGAGCPVCMNHSFDYTKPTILYYVKLNDGQAYKLGITNNSVKRRFSADSSVKITIIKEWTYATGREAYKVEQQLLKEHSSHKSNLILLHNGNTELFNTDILNLDC